MLGKRSRTRSQVKKVRFSDCETKREQLEQMAIICLRRLHFEELKSDLKTSLKDEYTEKRAEELFELFIDQAKQKGIVDQLIESYLEQAKNRNSKPSLRNTGTVMQ